MFQVNEVELRGKNVNEVCDILARMTGTLTMLVVPIPVDSEDGRGEQSSLVLNIFFNNLKIEFCFRLNKLIDIMTLMLFRQSSLSTFESSDRL